MKSNSKEVKKAVQEYILECMDFEGYNLPATAHNVYQQFINEHGYNIRQMGEQTAFTNWLKGLPSVLTVETYYNEVREILINRFKTNNPAKRDDNKSFEFFLYLIYVGIKDMMKVEECNRIITNLEKSFK